MSDSKIDELIENIKKEPTNPKYSLQAAELLGKFQRVYKSAFPETSGSYFICGGSPVGEDDLPDYVEICPMYGADGFARYKKDGEYTSPGY